MGVHARHEVVSSLVSPLQRAPAMYCPAGHEMRQSAQVLSKRVVPEQKPTMYCPGGCASYDRQRPLHLAHTLSFWTVELHSSRMYCPSSLLE